VPIRSAGILLHRGPADAPEVLLAHLGGPFWARKDAGAWSVPKGEYDPATESPRDAAIREFREELGVDPPPGPGIELGEFAYSSGKRVTVFALDGAGWDPAPFVFGEFELEWPPRSGRTRSFPEVDRAEWMPLPVAEPRLPAGQRPALDALLAALAR
jgi:predicted NUDIX family NTP pyrophosphohydrolase